MAGGEGPYNRPDRFPQTKMDCTRADAPNSTCNLDDEAVAKHVRALFRTRITTRHADRVETGPCFCVLGLPHVIYRVETGPCCCVPGLPHVIDRVETGPCCFVPGSPHVTLIELRQALVVVYQDYHMLSPNSRRCGSSSASGGPSWVSTRILGYKTTRGAVRNKERGERAPYAYPRMRVCVTATVRPRATDDGYKDDAAHRCAAIMGTAGLALPGRDRPPTADCLLITTKSAVLDGAREARHARAAQSSARRARSNRVPYF